MVDFTLTSLSQIVLNKIINKNIYHSFQNVRHQRNCRCYSSNHVFKDQHGLQRYPNKLYYLEDMVVFPV